MSINNPIKKDRKRQSKVQKVMLFSKIKDIKD
jgi:hypothetical protein